MLPEAITFDPTMGFSISLLFKKLDIQIFSRTPRLAQSEFGKAFKYVVKVGTKKREEGKIVDISRVDLAHLIWLLARLGAHTWYAKPWEACQSP